MRLVIELKQGNISGANVNKFICAYGSSPEHYVKGLAEALQKEVDALVKAFDQITSSLVETKLDTYDSLIKSVVKPSKMTRMNSVGALFNKKFKYNRITFAIGDFISMSGDKNATGASFNLLVPEVMTLDEWFEKYCEDTDPT